MSTPVCSSQIQCKVSGVFWTAVAVSLAASGFLAFELLTANASWAVFGVLLWLLLVPMGPTSFSVFYAIMVWFSKGEVGWLGLGITVGGAAWGGFMLNILERL